VGEVGEEEEVEVREEEEGMEVVEVVVEVAAVVEVEAAVEVAAVGAAEDFPVFWAPGFPRVRRGRRKNSHIFYMNSV